MTSYWTAIVKLTNSSLNKQKSAAKNKTETILRLNKKNFEDEDVAIMWIISNNKTNN